MSDLTDQELNKALAEKLLGLHEYAWCGNESSVKCKCGEFITPLEFEKPVHIRDGWSPTTDLNQIFKYLLPVLRAKDCTFKFDYFTIGFQIQIIIDIGDSYKTIRGGCANSDKIPEIICKAILEAWEKLNEENT